MDENAKVLAEVSSPGEMWEGKEAGIAEIAAETDAAAVAGMHLGENEARKLLEAGFPKAERILRDKDKLEEILLGLEKKLREVPAMGEMLSDLPILVLMIRDYANDDYKAAPMGTIVAAVSAVLYVAAPVDLIPDFVPVIGIVDDAAVVAFCMKLIHSDVEDYRAWRAAVL